MQSFDMEPGDVANFVDAITAEHHSDRFIDYLSSITTPSSTNLDDLLSSSFDPPIFNPTVLPDDPFLPGSPLPLIEPPSLALDPYLNPNLPPSSISPSCPPSLPSLTPSLPVSFVSASTLPSSPRLSPNSPSVKRPRPHPHNPPHISLSSASDVSLQPLSTTIPSSHTDTHQTTPSISPSPCSPSPSPSPSPLPPPSRSLSCTSPTPSSDFKRRRHPHSRSSPKSHTRKCREKVSRQFDCLVEVLPSPPEGTSIKHKAQVLEYTIATFHALLQRRQQLQTRLTLSSPSSLHAWLCTTLTSALSTKSNTPSRRRSTSTTGKGGSDKSDNSKTSLSILPLATFLRPFLELYAQYAEWPYAELWQLYPSCEGNFLEASLCEPVVTSTYNTTAETTTQKNLSRFAAQSYGAYAQRARLQNGLVHVTVQTGCTQHVDDIARDNFIFPRAAIAETYRLKVAESVPVMIHGSVVAVMVFIDVKRRMYSPNSLTELSGHLNEITGFYEGYIKDVHEEMNNNKDEIQEMSRGSSKEKRKVKTTSDGSGNVGLCVASSCDQGVREKTRSLAIKTESTKTQMGAGGHGRRGRVRGRGGRRGVGKCATVGA